MSKKKAYNAQQKRSLDVVSRWEDWRQRFLRKPLIYFPLFIVGGLCLAAAYLSQTVVQGWEPAKRLGCVLGVPLCEKPQSSIHFTAYPLIGSVGRDPFYLVIPLSVLNDSTENIEVSKLVFKINDRVIDGDMATFGETAVPARSRKGIYFIINNLEDQPLFLNETGLSLDALNKFKALVAFQMSQHKKSLDGSIPLPKAIKLNFTVTYTYGTEEIISDTNTIDYLPIRVTEWMKQKNN